MEVIVKFEVRECAGCSKPIKRKKFDPRTKKACCSPECTKKYLAAKMAKLNVELNPDRMTPEVRKKLREAHLGKGEGKAYPKIYGRHAHRVVMEEKLGRKLRPGEIVHHIDEDKTNNHPDNLQLFASQAEHARHHALMKPINPNTRKK